MSCRTEGEPSTTSSGRHRQVNLSCLPAGTYTLAARPFTSVQRQLHKHAMLSSGHVPAWCTHGFAMSPSLPRPARPLHGVFWGQLWGKQWLHRGWWPLPTPAGSQPSSPACAVVVALLHGSCCCFFLRGGFVPGACGGGGHGHPLTPRRLPPPLSCLRGLAWPPTAALEPGGEQRKEGQQPWTSIAPCW